MTSRDYTYNSDGNWTNSCDATYTQLCGVDLYETTNGTCGAVWAGYYSVSWDNSRTACSNYPDTLSRDYTYNSDGNGANNCNADYDPLCWVDLYETSNWVCSAVWNGYYSASNTNTRSSCSTKITNSYYTSDWNWTNSCTWSCNLNYTLTNWVCEADGRSCTITNWTWTQVWNWSSWWTCTVTTCNTDYYNPGNNTCSVVWIWYYSSSTSTSRTACTNHPDTASRDYTYDSDGNWTNSCQADYDQLCGVDLYETANGTCSAVGTGKYSPSSNNTIYSCSNKPSNSYYTSDGNGSNSCGWSCDNGYTKDWNRCNSAPTTPTITSPTDSSNMASWWTTSITLSASATDAQNDSLTYTWSATNATLSTTTWTSVVATLNYNWWPITITVVVSDWHLISTKSVTYTWTDTSYTEEYEEWVESGYEENITDIITLDPNWYDWYLWLLSVYNWVRSLRIDTDTWLSDCWAPYNEYTVGDLIGDEGFIRTYYVNKIVETTQWVDTSSYETRTRKIIQGKYVK